MQIRNAVAAVVVCALAMLPGTVAAGGAAGAQQSGASASGGKFDGDWITHLACEAHGETPEYKWKFPSTIKDGVYHGQHAAEGEPGYLVIDGKIGDDGNAKLTAKGVVTHNNAHGIFAMKGNNYSYDVQAHFDETHGTGKRNEGAGILGRPCAFEFEKQTGDSAAPAAAPGGDAGSAAKPDAPADTPPKQN